MRPGIATKTPSRELIPISLANVRTIVRRPLTGTIIAPPQPCKMRQATSSWMLVERPQRSEPSAKMPMAEEKTRRVPKRSAIQPLMGIKTARLSV